MQRNIRSIQSTMHTYTHTNTRTNDPHRTNFKKDSVRYRPNIVATAFNSSSQHLLIIVYFVAHLLLAGFHSALFNSPILGSGTFYTFQLYSMPTLRQGSIVSWTLRFCFKIFLWIYDFQCPPMGSASRVSNYCKEHCSRIVELSS